MVYSRWVFLTVPVFVLSATGLAFTIRGLLRTLSGSAVTSFPLHEEESFTLREPGTFDLYVEGKLGTTDFAGLKMELTDPGGRRVPLDQVLFRAHVSSFSRSRLLVRSFTVSAPGSYTLRVTGIRSTASPDDRIVLAHPVRGAMILHILGIVALGCLTIGSMVASALAFVLPGRAAQP
jgi:hypothetical protein